MGHKIFISYKHKDTNVKSLHGGFYSNDTVRTYVDELERYISDSSEHIYKGEHDGEDLSSYPEETIWKILKDKIYDSTLTIIMISRGMKDSVPDRDQWIPWEISYSLKEVSRKNINGDIKSSFSNALLAIVLPDRLGSYSYYIEDHDCCDDNCRTLNTPFLFEIMRKNMFNIRNPDRSECKNSREIFHGLSSYIYSVKWKDFVDSPEYYINIAYYIQSKIEQYNITKELSE